MLSVILIENVKKQKNKKREQCLQYSILEKLRSCFVPDLLTFCVKGKAKCARSKWDLLVCFTQGYSNLLKVLFLCNFFLNYKEVVGPEQQKTWSLKRRDGKGRRKEQTTLHLYLKFDFKGIVRWAEPCKCVILLVSRILWHKKNNPSLKEWRFWYLILTGHFLL